MLELTQEVPDEPPPPAVIAPPPPAPEPVQIAAVPQADPPKPENDVVFQTIEEEAPVSSEAPAVAPHDDIFSDQTRKAMDDTFASIPAAAEAAAPRRAGAAPRSRPVPDGASVETVFETRRARQLRAGAAEVARTNNSDAVIDSVKPLIREWMDEHFPALLEGAVRAEVERVVKRARATDPSLIQRLIRAGTPRTSLLTCTFRA